MKKQQLHAQLKVNGYNTRRLCEGQLGCEKDGFSTPFPPRCKQNEG
jgi:hypothetical protein